MLKYGLGLTRLRTSYKITYRLLRRSFLSLLAMTSLRASAKQSHLASIFKSNSVAKKLC